MKFNPEDFRKVALRVKEFGWFGLGTENDDILDYVAYLANCKLKEWLDNANTAYSTGNDEFTIKPISNPLYKAKLINIEKIEKVK